MWYVIQTMTGGEEELVRLIRKRIPETLFEGCFVMYYERIWRRQGKSIVHKEKLFPGYIFVISNEPQELYFQLKQIPLMSRLLAGEKYDFIPLQPEEETYLQSLLNGDGETIVRLSYVKKDAAGVIRKIEGPLKNHREQIVRYNWRKRYVVIEVELIGKKRELVLGIKLNEDLQMEKRES